MGEPTALPWKWHSRVEDDLQTGSIYSEERKGHAYAVAIAPQKTEQWTIDATLIVEAVNNHDRLTRENEAMRTVLYAAGNALEMIRLDLIENLTEPERSAFWKAVMYRDKIKAVLASLKEPTDAQ